MEVGDGLAAAIAGRHLGEALLISVAVAIAVSLLSIAGSSRFPGSW